MLFLSYSQDDQSWKMRWVGHVVHVGRQEVDRQLQFETEFRELNMDGRIRSEKEQSVGIDWIELAEEMVLH